MTCNIFVYPVNYVSSKTFGNFFQSIACFLHNYQEMLQLLDSLKLELQYFLYIPVIMYRKKSLKIFTISCLFLALVIGHASAAIPEERAEGFAMAIDIPVRVVSMGLIVIGTAVFIVSLPFALTSGSTGDAWTGLIVDPFEFTFTRPLGKFDDWRRGPMESSASSE